MNIGILIIIAGLFIWAYIEDKKKYNQLQEENNGMIKLIIENQKNLTENQKSLTNNLTESTNNIAKSLEIIANNLITIDKKIDRNYEAELNKK